MQIYFINMIHYFHRKHYFAKINKINNFKNILYLSLLFLE